MDNDAAASSLDSPVAQLGFLDPRLTVGYFGIKPGMKVAEFGVGRGYYALELARNVGPGGLVTGIDIVPGALEILDGNARNQGIQNIRLVLANLEILGATGLADSSQDFVLLANILFQSDKKEDIVAEAARVLKTDGRLAVIDWRKGASGILGPADAVRIDEADMKTLIVKAGFNFENIIDAGSFHYGMLFRKT